METKIKERAIFYYYSKLGWSSIFVVVRGVGNSSDIYESSATSIIKKITGKIINSIIEPIRLVNTVEIDPNIWKKKDLEAMWNFISADLYFKCSGSSKPYILGYIQNFSQPYFKYL